MTSFLALLITGLAAVHPVPYKVTPAMPDVAEPLAIQDVALHGYLGERVDKNEANRLREVDLEPLLVGFHKQPGSHPWIGEHIGKWIHAATLAWANSGDDKLKAKLDKAVHDLISYQEPSGYLGTYIPGKRFGLYEGADWDVWTHKYDLLGLLTYYKYTGDEQVLTTCRQIGNLLCETFGPGKKSILSAGTHEGMAATSVLEPMVILYRQTADNRYLDFAKYLVKSWEEKGGPQILSRLDAGKPIDQVGNGKAYEMLSNLVGVCELARTTGDTEYLKAAKNAWKDVVDHELYLTGSASYFEHFHPGTDLPNATSSNIGETCVTVTWIQLSEQLLRLTGESKYGNEIERSFYNHLAAAQNPDGKSWCYYTSLEGSKPYTSETCCCLSSGPRGMAMAPEMTYFVSHVKTKSTVYVNLLETSRANLTVGGHPVTIVQDSAFPISGKTQLSIRTDSSARFGLKIRIPTWAGNMTANRPSDKEDGWLIIGPRVWRNAETVYLRYDIRSSLIRGTGQNEGKAAMTWGPFVLAAQLHDGQKNFRGNLAQQTLTPIKDKLIFAATIENAKNTFQMVPFSEVGATGERYKIWLNAPGSNNSDIESAFMDAEEAFSIKGNVEGSINDGDTGSFVVTFNGKPQKEAWFALTSKVPKQIKRIVYAHGQTFHDGGWFVGSPEVEVKTTEGAPWTPLGTFPNYPKTTATYPGGLRGREVFTLNLSSPISILEVRVIGKPAHGDNPAQAFASCGELQVFPK